jgi:hypothetical protein
MNGGEFWILFWATIGAIIVFIGLTLEKFADWLNENFLGGYKPHKTLESVGWFLLMFGISIEIADAWWSANDAWQTKQMAIKNGPLNQPISDILASVRFRVNKTDFSELPNFGNPKRLADLWLVEPPDTNILFLNKDNTNFNLKFWNLEGPTQLPILDTDHSYSFSDQHGGRTYSMQFHFDEDWSGIEGINGLEMKVKEINHVNVIRINIKSLPHDLEILDGSVKLVINDTVVKKFEIPQQKNNLDGDPNATPFVILAYLTNSPIDTIK